MNRAQSHAKKHGIVLGFQLREHGRIHNRVEVERDPELREQIDLLQAGFECQLVFSDAIRIEPTRQRTRVEDIGCNAAPPQLRRAGE